ncbi:anthranilate phosphoribosyltransferase [Zalerion maritima]|uniref:Anthranilate phosphoribosyltransferase n=1 Tax=Zalerion maritima TaxID=339359 RepID=A0AAD5RJG3_9PEZI|nr:anthranilate phosphoribosyltransferase [Zalerion maritima]
MASPEVVDIKGHLGNLTKLTLQTPSDEKDKVVSAIAGAMDACLKGKVVPAQIAALLTTMHFLELDYIPDIIDVCAREMRENAAPVPVGALEQVMEQHKSLAAGSYRGGFCDLVGTGGDKHNTFNISTTASIISSSYLMMAKHGNRASTSKSGSADLLQSMGAKLEAVTPDFLPVIYKNTNYGFLFAPVFHPGMAHVGPIRKQLPWRTVFNLLGPLAHPVNELIESRVIGVARKELGPLFATVFEISGVDKALVVCGEENLDEISCAGPTNCWLVNSRKSGNMLSAQFGAFQVTPQDFGFPPHPLSEVAPGGTPEENSMILRKILAGDMDDEDPILHFVLINAAAMLAISGCCEETTEEANVRGIPGDVITKTGPGGLRLKEGVRRAKYAVNSGLAKKQWDGFVRITNS